MYRKFNPLVSYRKIGNTCEWVRRRERRCVCMSGALRKTARHFIRNTRTPIHLLAKNIHWAAVLPTELLCWWERSTENGQTGSSWQKGYSDNHSLQLWWAEKHLRMHKSNLEADGLQQQKTMSGFTSVSQEQKAEATVGTGSPKLDSWRLEKCSLVWWISRHSDIRVKIWRQQHDPTHGPNLSCVNSPGWWWWYNGVGNIFLAHFWPVNTNQSLREWHSLFEYCCWPCASPHGHNVPIF